MHGCPPNPGLDVGVGVGSLLVGVEVGGFGVLVGFTHKALLHMKLHVSAVYHIPL